MGGTANEHTVVRRLSAFDHEDYAQHLLRLDEATRYLRFGMPAKDQFLIDYANSCTLWDVVIYGYFVDGILRGAAELRPLGGDHNEGEAAFSVEAEFRGRGVGSQLFEKIVRAARNRSYQKLYMSCLATNRAMQALARRFAAEMSFEPGGSLGVVEPGHRDVNSLSGEAAEDAEAIFAIARLDLPGHSEIDPLGWFNSTARAV
ncbi:MAG TPA: GNAT family N-acetyltransferase [Beijerinckiaceae bacterium]|nr:GNAT family N-acetyltransferase [Beijerinckiaceae bacterium]